MAEMPLDVLNHRLGKIRDNGDPDFDNTMAAVDIDIELQEKFLFIPLEEIRALEIEEPHSGTYHAGSGPEKCSAQQSENPDWLYNHAMNALALYYRIKEREEQKKKLLANRPKPGFYVGQSPTNRFALVVTEDRRMLVPQAVGVQRFRDLGPQYDEAPQAWILERIDLTDGTVQA